MNIIDKALLNLVLIGLLMTLTVWGFKPKTSVNSGENAAHSVIISDSDGDGLRGKGDKPPTTSTTGDKAKKFVLGVGCGVGIVATVVGFAGGAFTGGLSAAVTGMTVVSATATACAAAFD